MDNKLANVISLSKRRGFVFPSSEIYGGFNSCYDFGPLGVEIKNNLKSQWWKEMTKKHKNIVGLDSAILLNPKVWIASGHLSAGFVDILVECKSCHKRFRSDEVKDDRCPECGGSLTSPRNFNLMMKTFIGPVEDSATTTYLRAETCQGIYINFENIINSMRLKIPFGVCQIGKAFRNEINPKDFLYRMREFEQMEMQWFCHPKDSTKYFDFWKKERLKWYLDLGIKKENIRFKEILKKDLPHYARTAIDIEYKFPFGWKEIEGIHNRGDWDLSNHSKISGKDLHYYDEKTSEKFFPNVIETSVGVDRSFLTFLCDAYLEIAGGRTKTTKPTKDVEVIMGFNPNIAPIKAAVLPLVKNNTQITQKAQEIFQELSSQFLCQYDEIGSIGRRYRRQDEIGTPISITIDFQTLEDNTVTLRDRDSMKQKRVKILNLTNIIRKLISGTS